MCLEIERQRKTEVKILFVFFFCFSFNFQSSHKKRQPKKRIQILFAIHLFFGLFCVSVRLEEYPPESGSGTNRLKASHGWSKRTCFWIGKDILLLNYSLSCCYSSSSYYLLPSKFDINFKFGKQ